MAKKATLTPVTDTALNAGAINTQLNAINDQLDNTLSLDGSTPNAMNADVDLNSNDILNAANIYATEVVVGGIPLASNVAAASASAAAALVSENNAATSETNAASSANAASTYDPTKRFNTVALLLADTTLTTLNTTVGDHFEAGGFRYIRVASSGDVTTAGGVLMDVLAGDDGLSINAFGPAFDGSTDDTAIVQAAFDAAAALGCDIICDAGTFKSEKITVSVGLKNIKLGKAIWVGGTAQTLIPRLSIAAAPTIGPRRYEVVMDMSNGDLMGIEGVLVQSDFGGVHIYGYTNHPTINHSGIKCLAGSDNCDFKGYKWEGFDTPTQRGFGVHCVGTVAAYGGFLPSGVTVRATVPVTNLRIHGCTFINGSYAWVANGTEFSTFSGNYCEGQNHRCVQLTAGCYRCAMSDNMYKDYLSTAVLFSYGSTECSSFNDTVDTQVYQSGEAAFNVQTGSTGTTVFGAKGYSSTNFFVYVGPGTSKTIVDGCVGEGFYVAGFVAQSDWDDPTDTNRSTLTFDRPNYGPASVLDPTFTKWTFADLDGVTIQNCSAGNAYTGRNTIAFGAIQMDSEDGVSIYDVNATFQNNKVHDISQVSTDFAVWRESGECNVKLVGNDFRDNGTKNAYAGATILWNDVVARWADNGLFDRAVISEGIGIDGATPSVATPASEDFAQVYTLTHTVATNLTNFTDGFNGQTIRIWGSVNATIKYNSGLIRTLGSVDVTPNSNQMIEFTRRSNIWFETGRSF